MSVLSVGDFFIPRYGVFMADGEGGFREVIRAGDAAPGVDGGSTFSYFQFLTTQGRNRLAFVGHLKGAGVDSDNRTGIWSADESGVLRLLVRSGDPAPAIGADVHFGKIAVDSDYRTESDNPRFTFNAAGEAAFHVDLVGAGVDPNGRGLFVASEHGSRLVVRSGDAAPGIPNGKFTAFPFTAYELAAPALNDYGQTAFLANLDGPTIYYGLSLWTKTAAGPLTLIAQVGEVAPGLGNGETMIADLRSPRINNAGQVAFAGLLSGPSINATNDEVLWMGTPGNLVTIVREGDVIPGSSGGAKFGSVFTASILPEAVPIINGRGQSAFLSALRGDEVTAENDSALWLRNPASGIELIAREGDPAPGGGAFGGFYGNSIHLNSFGQVAFGCFVRLPNSDDFESRIYAQDRRGQMTLIARQTGSSDFAFLWGSSGNQDGWQSAFNDRGQIIFGDWRGNSSSIYISNAVAVPEPRTLISLVLAGCCILRVRK